MYRDFVNDSWESFKEASQNRAVFLFGAGGKTESIIKKISKEYFITGIIDNDCQKWGRTIMGVEIYSPAVVLENENSVILIVSSYLGSIAAQLEEMGYRGKYFSYFWLNTENRATRIQTNILQENVKKLESCLEDKKSKEIVRKIIEKREIGFMDYSDIKTSPEYFLTDIFQFTEEEVYIDAGAFDGDSIEDFLDVVNGKCRRIIGFEADSQNYKLAMRNLEKYGEMIQIYNKALWNENKIGSFQATGDVSSAVSEYMEDSAFSQKVEFCRLDDIVENRKEKITFIKMDIEGVELEALEGAKEVIKKDKPKLAICIYHKLNDLWELPVYIKETFPEYKCFIRHHSNHYCDTVLYATCD